MRHKWTKRPVQRIPYDVPHAERRRMRHAGAGELCERCGMVRRRGTIQHSLWTYSGGGLTRSITPRTNGGIREAVPGCTAPDAALARSDVDSQLEATLRARVRRLFTLANKLTGVDWSMVAAGTHIALPSIIPLIDELRHEANKLANSVSEADKIGRRGK